MSVDKSEPSEFTRLLLADLARRGYGFAAWKAFLADAWARSLEDIENNPALTRSFMLSAAMTFVAGLIVIAVAWLFVSREIAVSSIALWLPWYGLACAFVLTHLGMADQGDGVVNERFSTPNQLTFMRLSLAPLVMVPGLAVPPTTETAFVFLGLIVFLSVTDVVDGWVARRRAEITRLGRMLDYLADNAFLVFVTAGLYLANAIPTSLLWVLVVRYPGSIVAALIMYFAKGPSSLHPTLIGRVTTLVTSVFLLALAVRLLLDVNWPAPETVSTVIWVLQIMIVANIAYLAFRGAAWGKE